MSSSNTTTLGALLEEYEQQELTLLPLGEYEVEIASVKPRQTDVVPTFKVVSGPHAGKRTMGGTISCNGNAAPRFFARMREVGLGKEWFQALGAEGLPVAEVMKAVAEALRGRVVLTSFTIEEPNKYHEDSRNKLEKFVRLISAPAQTVAGVPSIPQAPAAPVAQVPGNLPAAPQAPVAQPVVAAPPVAAPPAPVAAPVAAPAAAVAEATPAATVPGVPVIAATAAVAPPAAPVPATAAPVAAAVPAPVPAVVETIPQAPAPVAPVAEVPAPAEAAVAAPVAATIQVADEPDF